MERKALRILGALGGGIAAGIFGARLLPPIFASASGSVRAHLGGDPFESLIQEHRKIESCLREMEHTPTGNVGERTRLYITLRRTLAKHAMAEEDVVYPMLHDEAGAREDSKRLYDEHADVKIHLYELEQCLRNNQDWTGRVRSLSNLISSHVRDEEEVEFPKLRRALDNRQKRSLSAGIHREEAMVL
ncbi:MAG: hemerythrin domain-containing protein [Bryobacteraceae bacterium]